MIITFKTNITMKKFLYGVLSVLLLSTVSCKEKEPSGSQPDAPQPKIEITQGEVTSDQIEFFLSATDADEVAYYFQETTDEVPLLTVQSLFKNGEVYAASAEPVSFVMSDLTPETEYTVYAAASKDGQYFSKIKELTIFTAAKQKMLEFVSANKTEFSYKVNVEEGQSYFHTYFEGWYFEYNYELNKYIAEASGEEFDASVFIWNMLATMGSLGKDSQVITWYAGQENENRGEQAFLVPGIKYYAVAALYDEETGMWYEDQKPQIISFSMAEPGESSQTVDCTIDGVSPYSVNIRMECDEALVNFFKYNLYPLSQYKSYVAENGKEGMMKYVSEYGYGKGNTYTDTWTVNPGESYMHCLYGVDFNGDEFYQDMLVQIPLPEAKIHLSLSPYERDLEGYNTYNTLKVSATFADFIGLDYESSVFYLPAGPVKKSDFDAMLASAGLGGTFEDLEVNGEMLYALAQANLGMNPVSAEPELIAELKDKKAFDKVYTGLDADTEYVYMVIAFYDGKTMCRLVSGKTDPAPIEVTESDAYKAFLGNWTVNGKQTTDWATYSSYHIRIERLTSNRSYKIYGWSSQQVGQDYPFEASFDEATNKIKIQTPQVLGTVVIEDYEYEIHFVGKAYKSGQEALIVLGDYEGLAYAGKLNGSYLSLMGEMPQYIGQWWEFKSMSYVLYDRANKEYFALEPYDLVYFQTVRE